MKLLLQATLDQEIRQRAEAVRSRKKMEADFNDLEISLATSQRHADESQKTTKNLTLSIKDLHVKLEDITRATEDAREQVNFQAIYQNFQIFRSRELLPIDELD